MNQLSISQARQTILANIAASPKASYLAPIVRSNHPRQVKNFIIPKAANLSIKDDNLGKHSTSAEKD